jgi:hypothetical protein
MALPPWSSGPGEILQHGFTLLIKDTDANRRLAMLSIDNAVELMIKTFLGLPRRATGIKLSRKEYTEISESFPALLDALEEHASEKLTGIDLAEIEWYHRLRNQLYHQGNGLTVERQKVEVYAELAKLLFKNLFGADLEIKKESESADTLGTFLATWAELESVLERLSIVCSLGETRSVVRASPGLVRLGVLDKASAKELDRLRQIRNQVVHGKIDDYKAAIGKETMQSLRDILKKLEAEYAAAIEPVNDAAPRTKETDIPF